MRNSLYYIPMNSVIIKYIGEGVLPVLLLGAASLFADDTDARLQAYKANRLIPQEFSLIRAGSDSDITFATNSLSWNTSGAISQALRAELSKMNAQELLDFIKAKEGGQTALDYLAALANGSETSSNITAEEAKADILALFARHCTFFGVAGNCPWDGVLDVTSVDIGQRIWLGVDLGNFKMTPTQIAAQSEYQDVSGLDEKLAQLSGDEPWLVKKLRGVDMTKISNFTAEKLAGMEYIGNCKLPTSLVFTGDENLSNLTIANYSGSYPADISGWKGMTLQQVASLATNPAVAGCSFELPIEINWDKTNMAGISLKGMNLAGLTNANASKIMAASSFRNTVLPAMDLSKVSSLNVANTSTFDGTDFSRCSNLSSNLIEQIYSAPSIKLNQAQYDSLKDTIAAQTSAGKSRIVYVDGKRVTITGTNTNPLP